MGDMRFSLTSIFQHAFGRQDAPEDMGNTNGYVVALVPLKDRSLRVVGWISFTRTSLGTDFSSGCEGRLLTSCQLDMGRGCARNGDTSTVTTRRSPGTMATSLGNSESPLQERVLQPVIVPSDAGHDPARVCTVFCDALLDHANATIQRASRKKKKRSPHSRSIRLYCSSPCRREVQRR